MKKIVLFGATGQLGYDIQSVFKDSEYIIIPLSSKDFDFSNNYDCTELLSEKWPFDYLINAMALTDTTLCEEDPELANKINHLAVVKMAEFCSSKSIPLYHFSTDYIFDGKKGDSYVESDSPNPLNNYGESKKKAEDAISSLHKTSFIFRVSSLFGTNPVANNFVNSIIEKSKTLKELSIVSDQMMSPTHTLDIARAVKHFIQNDITKYGIYNCSSSDGCSWFTFANEIIKKMEISVDVKEVSHTVYPSKLVRPESSILSTNKLNGIFKMPSWREALDEFLEIKKEQGLQR